jgi:DNA-binding CsgD family transcriptional regulator
VASSTLEKVIYGRDAELAVLRDLVSEARTGSSASVLVEGEPGIGKTALLDMVRGSAEGMRVLSATGVEAEADLPFGTTHQLLRPVIGLSDSIPEPQADALRGALGLADPTDHDRFLVAAAVLSILGEAARERGLVCLVDDAQWIDDASADALVFAARRMSGERVLMVTAARPGPSTDRWAPLRRRIGLTGLTATEAVALVGAHASAAPSESVGSRLVEATRGNPLALVELAGLLTAEQLAGNSPLPDPLPLTAGLEHAFLEQVRRLPSDVQILLLVTALDSTGRLDTVLAAARLLDVDEAALHEAESSSLLDVDGAEVRLRHPLIRSTIVAGSSSTQRRRVHLMLSEVLTPDDVDRSAWHRAAATLGPDETIAAQLDDAAVRALSRSAQSAAAAAYERAAELTPLPADRGRRLLAAARASWLGARPDRAIAAVMAARTLLEDPLQQAELARLHGIIEWQRGVCTEASSILLEGAQIAASNGEARLALTMLVEAGQAAGYAGDMETLQVAGRLADDIDPAGEPSAVFAKDLALGFSEMVTGNGATGATLLSRALDWAETTHDSAQLILASSAAFWLGNTGAASRLADRAVRTARVADLVGSLPHALEYYSLAERLLGHFDIAAASASEGLELARDTGQLCSVVQHLSTLATVSAVRGEAGECEQLAEECLALAVPRRLLVSTYYARHAQALSALFRGEYAEALRRLLELKELPTFDWYAVPDLVEAAHRCGQPDTAREAISWMEPWATDASSPGATALLLRCRAITSADDEAGSLFEAAASDHPDAMVLERGRTELLYGEWLRRQRRKSEARARLHSALTLFRSIGAEPLARRARAELRAAGEADARADGSSMPALTAQELQVALLVAQGASNREVATRLFISPRTVEYHLYKIYPKLGVVSRTDLVRHMATSGLQLTE